MACIKHCAKMDMLHCRGQRAEIEEELRKLEEEERRLYDELNGGPLLRLRYWFKRFSRFFKILI